ncbi:FAD-dependent oxidoreductase [Streptomyces sp. NBC_01116]|uniref:flavin monoamine oxidase family protein n=1 Tax=Streptomyces sp. NBC_01116 TaxID=2903752 RepID=UPI003249EB74
MNNSRSLSRRTLIRAGGATALGAGAATALARPAAARHRAPSADYDAIVIGAGFAGATAARDLRDKGLRPLVLEARDRIGGRVWSTTHFGEQIELGGTWLHPNYHRTYAEMRRYGLTTVGDVAPTTFIVPTESGYRPVDPVATGARMDELLGQIFDGSRQYFERPEEPLFRADLLAKVDRLSLADRMTQLRLSTQDLNLIEGQMATYSGGNAAQGGLTALAQWWALCGWTPEGWNQMNAARVKNGAVTLIQAILDGAQADVRLSTPVAKISEAGGRVTVTTKSGAQFSAPVAVVAVPLNKWKSIQFSPGLPAVHAAATKEGVGIRPIAAKMWIRLAGNLERVAVQGAAGDPIASMFTHGYLSNGDSLMIAINGPGLDVTSKASVDAAIKRVLPDSRVVDMRVQDWANDPFSDGGWGMRKPGQMLRQLPAIHQPHGRITFANGDMPSGWIGSFEGAIETGARAASQAAALV